MSGPSSGSPPRSPLKNQVKCAANKTSASSQIPTGGENGNLVDSDSALQRKDSTKTKSSTQTGHTGASTPSQSHSPPRQHSQEGPQPKTPPRNDVRVRAQPPGLPYPSLAPIAPAPIIFPLASSHSRPVQGAPRAKRRRLTGAGRRWSAAADKFVAEIPAVPFFSDREVPMRDMRGWITTISKSPQKLVWDRFMGALNEEDFADGGDADICRYILSSVIYEAQDPNSSKMQTRQAVNNAIKRELRLSKETGTTGRGQTFRELFRVKATQAGFRVSTSLDDSKMVFQDMKDLDHSALPDSAVLHGSPPLFQLSGGTKGMSHGRLAFIHSVDGHKGNGGGIGVIPQNWDNVLQNCETTFAGERAYWTLPFLDKSESFRTLISFLVDRNYIHDLKRILVEFRWIVKHAESSRSGILHLVKYGYDVLLAVKTQVLNVFEREGYRLIRNALMLIRPVLQSAICEPAELDNLRSQLATQLYGRLLKDSVRFSVISALLESIRMHAAEPWLRPLNPCFESPRTDIAIAVRSGVNTVSSAIAMSKDGELVLTAGEDLGTNSGRQGHGPGPHRQTYSVRVWDSSSGKCVSRIKGHNSSVLYLAITPNKKHVVSCAGAQLMFWTIVNENGKYIPEVTEEIPIKGPERTSVFSVAVLPDNKRAVVAHGDFKMRIWNIVKGKIEKEFEANPTAIYSLDVSTDGNFVVSGDSCGLVTVWRISSGKLVIRFKNESSVFGVSFMAPAKVKKGEIEALKVVVGSAGSLKVWTCPDLQQDYGPEPYNNAESETLYPSGNDQSTDLKFYSIRCTGTGTVFSGGSDGTVGMWKLQQNGKWKKTKLVNDAPVRLGGSPRFTLGGASSAFIAVSDDGRKVASSSVSPLIAVWDVEQYEETLSTQDTSLTESYFPYRPESVCHTDMYYGGPPIPPPNAGQQAQPRHGLPTDLGVYFAVGGDDDLRIMGTLGNVLKLMVDDKHERIITFDENIQSARCGSFFASFSQQAKRKGVAVRFADKSLAFFEVESKSLTERPSVQFEP